MGDLRYTLLGDGSSDQALMPIISWLLRQIGVQHAIQAQWADLSRLRRRPQTLAERVIGTLDLYPCDLLCLHRDAEGFPAERRKDEIRQALAAIAYTRNLPASSVAVIPVRMTEAWLLFDEAVIRMAAGNPRGRVQLNMPKMPEIEGLADPKARLAELFRVASEQTGRRLKNLAIRPQRVADLIDDFSPLRSLPAFQSFETELRQVVTDQGWN